MAPAPKAMAALANMTMRQSWSKRGIRTLVMSASEAALPSAGPDV